MIPATSIVVPAYNEGKSIIGCLNRLSDEVHTPFEVLVVYDSPSDTTADFVHAYAQSDARVRPLLNTYGKGPAFAIRFGVDNARSDVIVITMADGSDDVRQIDTLVSLVREGATVAAASRYAPGGRQHGGPRLKRVLSRSAGVSLDRLASIGTRDATNSFKAYSADFIKLVGIESTSGFEVGIELVAKAARLGLPVVEIPTTWIDRSEGTSNFRMRWVPRYLRWYLFALGIGGSTLHIVDEVKS